MIEFTEEDRKRLTSDEAVEIVQDAICSCAVNFPGDEVTRVALAALAKWFAEDPCDCDPDMRIAADCNEHGCREARRSGAVQIDPPARKLAERPAGDAGLRERLTALAGRDAGPYDRERFTIAICPRCGARCVQTQQQRDLGGTYCYCATNKGDATRCNEIEAVALAALADSTEGGERS